MKKREKTIQLKSERGASLIEYVLLVALIAIIALAAVTLAGQATKQTFNTVSTHLTGNTVRPGEGTGGDE